MIIKITLSACVNDAIGGMQTTCYWVRNQVIYEFFLTMWTTVYMRVGDVRLECALWIVSEKCCCRTARTRGRILFLQVRGWTNNLSWYLGSCPLGCSLTRCHSLPTCVNVLFQAEEAFWCSFLVLQPGPSGCTLTWAGSLVGKMSWRIINPIKWIFFTCTPRCFADRFL